MKFLILALALSFAGSAHAESLNERAESHLKLARGFAIALSKVQSARIYHEAASNVQENRNLEIEVQQTKNLAAMRELLSQDFRVVTNDVDLKHRIGNVIRSIDSMNDPRYGSAAESLSRRGVR